jgi:hypothetical protein
MSRDKKNYLNSAVRVPEVTSVSKEGQSELPTRYCVRTSRPHDAVQQAESHSRITINYTD